MLILALRAEIASGQLFLFNSMGNKGNKKGLRKFRTTRFQGSSLPSACGLRITDTKELTGLSHFIQLTVGHPWVTVSWGNLGTHPSSGTKGGLHCWCSQPQAPQKDHTRDGAD